jgi:hypothetical protein
LDWYDYGARFYDASLGRFHTLDPLAVGAPRITPYFYAHNKPINCIDHNGLWAIQVGYTFRGACPIAYGFGFSGALEVGLILDENNDLVAYVTAALGGSYGGSLSRGLAGAYYHGANTWHDLMGMGLDAGVSTPFKFSAQWEGSFAGSGFKNGFSLSSSVPRGINFSVGKAVYADVTFTGRMEDFGIKNISDIKEDMVVKVAQMMMITKKQARMILGLLQKEFEKKEKENKPIELPEVTVYGTKPESMKDYEKMMEDLLWMGVRPNANGNTGRYNKPGRSSDKNYSDDFLKWYYGIDEDSED